MNLLNRFDELRRFSQTGMERARAREFFVGEPTSQNVSAADRDNPFPCPWSSPRWQVVGGWYNGVDA